MIEFSINTLTVYAPWVIQPKSEIEIDVSAIGYGDKSDWATYMESLPKDLLKGVEIVEWEYVKCLRAEIPFDEVRRYRARINGDLETWPVSGSIQYEDAMARYLARVECNTPEDDKKEITK